MEKSEWLKAFLKNLQSCSRCDLAKIDENVFDGKNHGKVYSFGKKFDLFFVAIAPSYYRSDFAVFTSDKNGAIFQRGLDILELKREDVYVTNLVKCSTLKNEEPSQQEINSCRHNLDLELHNLLPKIVITVGALPRSVFKLNAFGEHRRGLRYELFSIRHPTWVVRNEDNLDDFLEDFKKLKRILEELK